MNEFKAQINRLNRLKLRMSVKGEMFEYDNYNITKNYIYFCVIFVTTMILFIERPSYI